MSKKSKESHKTFNTSIVTNTHTEYNPLLHNFQKNIDDNSYQFHYYTCYNDNNSELYKI